MYSDDQHHMPAAVAIGQQYYYNPWPPTASPYGAASYFPASYGMYTGHLVHVQQPQTHRHQPRISSRHEVIPNTKLFVGNLAWATDEFSLQAAFGVYGIITESVILKDRESGRSRGFGFVTYSSPEEATMAVHNMNGRELDGRALRVNLASERAKDTISTTTMSNYSSSSTSISNSTL